MNLSPTQPAPGSRLDSSACTDIGPLTCRTCHEQYYFTAGEQAFYAQKNSDDQPKSCKKCRTLAKAGNSGNPLLLLPPLLVDGALLAQLTPQCKRLVGCQWQNLAPEC